MIVKRRTCHLKTSVTIRRTRETESSHFVFSGHKSLKLLRNVSTGSERLQDTGGPDVYFQELPVQKPGHDG